MVKHFGGGISREENFFRKWRFSIHLKKKKKDFLLIIFPPTPGLFIVNTHSAPPRLGRRPKNPMPFQLQQHRLLLRTEVRQSLALNDFTREDRGGDGGGGKTGQSRKGCSRGGDGTSWMWPSFWLPSTDILMALLFETGPHLCFPSDPE